MTLSLVRAAVVVLLAAALADAANEVKLMSYTFNGAAFKGSLSLANLAYAKAVTVAYANTAGAWGNTCAAKYSSGPDASNREAWSFNCAIGAAGISQFYVEYKVSGQTYYDSNGGFGANYKVTPGPTSSPAPSRCTLTINATDTKTLRMSCASATIRFVGIGDWGEKAMNAGLTAVRDAILAQADAIDFIVNAGDNFYHTGVSSTTDAQWTNTWLNRYAIGSKLTVPWFSVMGNHDHHGNSTAQLEFAKASLPGSTYWVMPGEFYAVDVLDASGNKFKLVHTDIITAQDADLVWISAQLEDASAAFALVLGHFHVYSAGRRGDQTDANVKRLNTLMQGSSKAKAYICGHEHDMQLLRAGNLDYYGVGGGGRGIDFNAVAPGTAAAIKYYQRNYGFVVYEVDVAARTMSATFNIFDRNGVKVESRAFNSQY